MAGFSIHLAIAKIYLENNKVQAPNEFLKGVIDPDLVKNKTISHYSDFTDQDNLQAYLKHKVNLKRYLEGNTLYSDYQKGFFLHLITDYEMYNNFFDKEYIENISFEDFSNNIYYSYDFTNNWVNKKYPVEFLELQKKIEQRVKKKKERLKLDKKKKCQNVLPLKKLDQWIQTIGNINLEKYKEKILEESED